MKLSAVGVVVFAFSFACSGKKTEPASTGSGSAAAPAPTKEEPPAKGLKAKDNDPAIVALATEALKCKVEGSRLEWNCAGYKAWRDGKGFEDNKNEKTLANFLDDTDEKVRFLAADKLRENEPKDPAIAKRILAVAQAEASPLVGEWLGRGLAKLDVTAAGIAADAVKLISDGKTPELRYGLVIEGAQNPAYTDAILKLANEGTDPKLRRAAVEAFYNNTPAGKEADVCKMWLANVDSTDNEIAGGAANIDGSVSSCKDNWDALLDKLEARAKDNKFESFDMVGALGRLNDGSTATDAQKKRAIDLAKAIASNEKLTDSPRGRALEIVAPLDAKFAATFAKGKNDYLKGVAERATKK